MSADVRRLAALEAEAIVLRAELAELDRVVDTVTRCTLSGWWTWYPREDRVEISDSLRALLGHSPETLPDDTAAWQAALTPIGADWSAIEAHLLAGGAFDLMLQCLRADGEPIYLSCRGHVLEHGPDGLPSLVVGAHTDLTVAVEAALAPRARLEEQTRELQRLNQELEGRNLALDRAKSALEDFAYAASHDLQAPLRAIAHFAIWIEEDLPADATPTVREHVVRLRDRVDRMTRLQENLLTYAHITRREPERVVVDLVALVADVWTLVSAPDDFELAIEVDGPLTLELAEAPLRTVLRNLLSNAVAHHDRPAGVVRVGLANSPSELTVRVEDDGPG
ncbi:MAG: PAS domain-containing sensor histidine kinase, partial [Myxococcales bacterium]|nr:PAS domain-containing sensor histidine kinase [Myxococcales bacterium]